MIELKWEVIDAGNTNASRCAVPGGWILQFIQQVNEPNVFLFIPDPGHTWGRLDERRKNLETVYKAREETGATNTKPRIEEKREPVVTSEGTVGGQACPTCNGLGSTGELFESERCIACNGTGIDRG